MKPPLPDPGPFREGPVADIGEILDAFNRRRGEKGWTFRQLDAAVGTCLNLNAMILRGAAAGESLFRLADALGLEIIVRPKVKGVPGRRHRMRLLREAAAQSATEPVGGPEE